jgi:hypothetical protein
MSECTCLARLERALLDGMFVERKALPLGADLRASNLAAQTVIDACRAAQNVAPVAGHDSFAPSQDGAGSAAGAAPVFPDMKGPSIEFTYDYIAGLQAENDRLRAWEKWAQTTAVKALRYYENDKYFAEARQALATRPKDAT